MCEGVLCLRASSNEVVLCVCADGGRGASLFKLRENTQTQVLLASVGAIARCLLLSSHRRDGSMTVGDAAGCGQLKTSLSPALPLTQ